LQAFSRIIFNNLFFFKILITKNVDL